MVNPAAIELHIEELVLHGFAPGDRDRIGEVLQQELTRLFSEQGISPSLAQTSEILRLNQGAFQMTAGMQAEAIGVQIAQSIYQGFHL